MQFKIEEYTPINWKTWILGGRGDNIKPPFYKTTFFIRETLANLETNLSEKHWRIWEQIPFFEDIKDRKDIENFPAQDARDDPGQGEIVTYFSKKLLDYISGEEDVVIPAAMFHDTGYTIDPEEFRKAFLNIPENEDPEITKLKQLKIRLEHQVRGAKHAYDYLTRLGWNPQHTAEIVRIISDHDTRFFPPTSNGSIMQDADILWRFTVPCLQSYHADKSADELLETLTQIELSSQDRFYHDEVSRPIARLELANSLIYLHPNQAARVLEERGYEGELARLIS